jgi:pectin methylesterase-like acyl-CoA thioesterase
MNQPLRITVALFATTLSAPLLLHAEGQPTVAYVYNSTYNTYCGLSEDPIYQSLVSSELYDITPYDVNGKEAASYTDLLNYSLVISTEANGGTNAFGLKLKELVGQVPMLNLKTYYFSSGRWDWGTCSNPSPKTSVMSLNDPELALYDGLLTSAEGQTSVYLPNSGSNQLQACVPSVSDVVTLSTVSGGTSIFAIGENFLHVGFSYDDIIEVNGNGRQLVLNAVEILTDANRSVADKGTSPRLVNIAVDGTALGVEDLGRLSNGQLNIKLEQYPSVWPEITAAATNGGQVRISQPSSDDPQATITLLDAAGEELSSYVLNFITTEPVEKHAFDFVVGVDGDINDAITAANAHDSNKRFHIFIPNGQYLLTGNTTITPGKAINDSLQNSVDPGTFNNSMTHIKKGKVSLIGESRDGVVLYNEPLYCGISYTSTIEFRSSNENYIQDLTIRNNYAYGRHDRGVAVAYYDRGEKNVLKNVLLWSNQDTYTSAGTRGYFEDCEIAGTVDFICGSGDYYFSNCQLTLNNRSGNVICAPRTAATEEWGYVFDHCTIDKATGASNVVDKKWSLGRPWNNSPAATYLYTTMKTVPSDAGWAKMSDSTVCRFHEYGSVTASGSSVSTSKRSISACNAKAESDSPVLTAAQAARYTLENVLGGEDSYDPTTLTAQVPAPEVTAEGENLSWEDNTNASCYVIFRDGVYLTNQVETTFTAAESGVYTVRAANGRGGLGIASNEVTISTSTGIEELRSEQKPATEGVAFDLAGRRVRRTNSGLLIIEGKKRIVK